MNPPHAVPPKALASPKPPAGTPAATNPPAATAAAPRLSVVVPVHNVAAYLEECLASLAAQTMGALDVVVVDDGSTDDSPRIAEEFTRRDARFRWLRQPHAGLSAARNTGVAHTAPGTDYLAFADSDDVLAPDAYARLTASLDASGSDFASGNVWRLDAGGRRQAWQYRWLTADRPRTHITRDPRLLTDRVAWNKVFRRSFWDRHAFSFPVGRLYEDTPVVIPAHFLADAVDVVSEHVYYWRVREGSITQRRTDPQGVRDRIAGCEDVSRFLAGALPGQRRRYDTSCLGDDFGYFLQGLPLGGPAYREAFMTGARAFLERAGTDATRCLSPDLRVKWQLVRENRLDELVEVLAFEQANGVGVFPVRAGRVTYPGVGPLAGRAARVRRGELPVVARLSGVQRRPDKTLRLTGFAYVRNAGPGRLLLALGQERGGRRLRRFPVRAISLPPTTDNASPEPVGRARAGFELTLDPARLGDGEWLVGVVLAGAGGGAGTVRRAALRPLEQCGDPVLVQEVPDGRRLLIGAREGRLVVSVRRHGAVVDTHGLVDADKDGDVDADTDAVELGGRLWGAGPHPTQLTVRHGRSGAECTYAVRMDRDGGRFAVRVALSDLTGVPRAPHVLPRGVPAPDADRWEVRLVHPDGSRHAVPAALDLAPGHYPGDLSVRADASGFLALERAECRPTRS
ncbi:glycosyltransferase [Streptomyces sp. NPDC020719]|uniref:glycosyltransferase family 2 protein n=1 Tax=Streptomyces sp. NPDC020719 TaxID=3154896 RepID=UPI0033D0773D